MCFFTAGAATVTIYLHNRSGSSLIPVSILREKRVYQHNDTDALIEDTATNEKKQQADYYDEDAIDTVTPAQRIA
jgi:hypothetical protein